jgi:AraC family transcriptional regulator
VIPVNPAAAQLGSTNAILWGRGNKSYHVREFPGPLSIKSMVRGVGSWSTPEQDFSLSPRSGYLLLNDQQPYSITIDSPRPVETFCVFFHRGFVEQAWETAITRPDSLLDLGQRDMRLEFAETVRSSDTLVSPLLQRMHAKVSARQPVLDDDFRELANALLYLRPEFERMLARIPAAKPSTRIELALRLGRAREFLENSLADSITLDDIGKAACLSAFHLHRAFRQFYGETPQAYLSRRRLEMAAALLVETDVSVTEISLRCGHESLGTFSSSFRRKYQGSPREFREKFASRKKS